MKCFFIDSNHQRHEMFRILLIFFSYIVILECGAGRRFGQLQFGKYRQLWRFDFCFQWGCERGHIGAWRVPGDGE